MHVKVTFFFFCVEMRLLCHAALTKPTTSVVFCHQSIKCIMCCLVQLSSGKLRRKCKLLTRTVTVNSFLLFSILNYKLVAILSLFCGNLHLLIYFYWHCIFVCLSKPSTIIGSSRENVELFGIHIVDLVIIKFYQYKLNK